MRVRAKDFFRDANTKRVYYPRILYERTTKECISARRMNPEGGERHGETEFRKSHTWILKSMQLSI